MSFPKTANPMPDWIRDPHPHVSSCLVTFPRKHVILVTINRPEQMNCLPIADCRELGALWKWYDLEPELRCAVFTGAGSKAFCTGMDLKESLQIIDSKGIGMEHPTSGFAGMTNRTGKKPIVVAANGHAHGGGFEIALNADIVFASPNTTFRLPEVLRGVAPLGGALPRCMVMFGNQRTMDLVLTGRPLSAKEAAQWGLVKEIVPQEELVEKTLDYAEEVAMHSPDSVIISRLLAREAWEEVQHATTKGYEMWKDAMSRELNAEEGLKAFKEKRTPRWRPSRL